MNNDLGDIDKALFVGMMRGDLNAFEQLFQKYYVGLCNYCEVILGDPMEAEDVVQELFVHLWTDRGVEVVGSVKSYLFSSVKHRAMNVLKHQAVRRKHNPLVLEFLNDLSSSDYSEEEIALLEKIRNIIEHLPPQCKTVFIMSCMEGKKYKEIADELGLSVNTVKSHIVKAYHDIRTAVGLKGFILFRAFYQASKVNEPFSSFIKKYGENLKN